MRKNCAVKVKVMLECTVYCNNYCRKFIIEF